MKAATCRAGREAMIAFCKQEGIAYDLCGKVIVAVDETELSRLGRAWSVEGLTTACPASW